MAESKFLIKFSNVNRDKYVYGSPVTSKQGYVECKCEYMRENNKPAAFFFESPRLIAATGIYSLDNKFYIDLLVPMASPFLDWLLAEDEKNINATADNSEAWFGERSSVEEISQGYKTSLIFRSKGEEPVIRVNIPSIRGKPAIEVFDNNKKVIESSSVVPGVEVACIMEKMPLRFYRDKFTGEYLIYKLKVCSNSQVVTLPPGYIFSEQTTDEETSEVSGDEEDIQLESGSDSDAEENDPLAVSGDEDDHQLTSGSEDDHQLTSGSEEEDPLAVSGDEDDHQLTSGSEDDHQLTSGSESEEEEDPLAVSGDEDDHQLTSGSEEEDPLAVSGDESEEEDPLAVSGDESEEEDPLAVSGDEDDHQLTSGSESEEEDPLAVSGDEDDHQLKSGSESEEEDPLAVSGDEDDIIDNNSKLHGTTKLSLEQDGSSEFELDSEFDISEGGEAEEVKKKSGLVMTSNELTESDFELDDLNV